MKKFLLVISMIQFLSLSAWAIHYEIIFDGESQVGSGAHPETQVPITGNVNGENKELNLYYDGIDYANVSVKDSNGTIVYQGQFNTSSRKSINVDLNSYQQGNYTINVEDSEGNIAVGNFQVKK